MTQIQLKQIGYLAKTHGIFGELVLSLNEGISFDLIEEILTEGDAVFIEIDGIPVPFFIAGDGLREHSGKSAIIKFDDLDTQKVQKLVPSKVFLENEKLNLPDKQSALAAYAWIGFHISDKNNSFSGEVKEIVEIKDNPMLNIECGKKNLLVPLNSDFIVAVDRRKKKILIELPDGYLDALL